jgi:hypothetical protein
MCPHADLQRDRAGTDGLWRRADLELARSWLLGEIYPSFTDDDSAVSS